MNQALENEAALSRLMDLSEYLTLAIFAAADRGDEERVVAGFEGLM